MKNLVLQHPAWLAYPNIKSFELHPRLPICVGFWDGTTAGVAPNANQLQNSGLISDLLRLTDNPKGLHLTQTQLSNTKSTKTLGPISRMAITVHIRPIGDDSEDEDNNIQLRIKQEDNSSSTHALLSSTKERQRLAISQTEDSNNSSSVLDISDAKEQSPDSTKSTQVTSPTGSTTQEDTPPPLYLPSNPLSSSSKDFIRVHDTSLASSQRPSTPSSSLSTQPTLTRKRSLTLLSPEQISIRSTREPQRKSSSNNSFSATLSTADSTTCTKNTTDRT